MKKFCTIVAAVAVLVSCQKQPSEEEKKAEVEKQVQERLAAEHQTQEQQRLAQQQADLAAREKAVADKEAAAAATVPESTPLKSETVRSDNTDVAETSEPRSTAAYGTFYRKLEPYGEWRETSDYGYVWQPREAESRDWRPYTDGNWVYTDAGWTWVSEEPFGWATYHYGRWVRLRRVGWVWVPGEEWAPAWVSWRTSKDYVGWAPLPPEARFDRKHGIHNWADNYYDIGPDQYAFVPGNEFGAQHVQTSIVPVERNVTIVIDTTNVTNITYSNTTVVNQGPNYEEMRSRSKQPIERYRLQRQVEMTSDTSKPIVRGEVLEMSAPVITRVPGIDRPQRVKETLTEATVEKTWTAETDRAASERARTKMKAEVTPPPDAPSKRFVRPTSVTVSSTPVASVAATAPTPAAPSATPSTTARMTAAPMSTRMPSATARPTAAPISTPTPAHTIRPTAAPISTSTPLQTARPTAAPISTPVASQTARPTAAPSPTATVFPSVTPRRLVTPRSPRPSPAITPAPPTPASPQASVAPPMTPSISTPSVTPDRAAQLRRFHPPASPRPSAAAAGPSEPAVKPTRPPLVPGSTPPPPATPPASDVPATTSPSPVARNPKPNDRKPRRPGEGEGEKPTPTPSTAP
jgi:hypothetical protein